MEFQQLTEEDLRKQAEDEYYRLENKFRLSEVKNQSYSPKVRAILSQQETILEILGNENKELQTNITVTTCKALDDKENQGLTNIYNFIEKEKSLDDDICNEKSLLNDLRSEIDKVKKDIVQFNKTDVHEVRITENIKKSEQRIRYLEDKLQVTTTRFNNMLTQNTVYRNEIEALLNERKDFFKTYMRLFNQLKHGKHIMLDLVEQATSTYDQREEALTKLNSLKQKTKVEKHIQSKDVQDLKIKLEISTDLYDFLSIKGQRRVLADLEAREAREKKRLREEMEDKIEKYIKLLDKIKRLSDEKQIDKFIVRFKKCEQENMSVFNYVNDINDEVEVLQRQVTALLDQIDEQRALNEKRSIEQVELIDCLTDKVSEKQLEYDKAVESLNASDTKLNNLLSNIEKMFQEYECNPQPVIALLGDNAHVNVYNVVLCLKVIERQLFEFIYITYAKEKQVPPESLLQGAIIQEDIHTIAAERPLIYHLAGPSPCPLCVETDRLFVLDENNEADSLEEYSFVHKLLINKMESTELDSLLHNISACRLPRSRAIMQARFQEQE